MGGVSDFMSWARLPDRKWFSYNSSMFVWNKQLFLTDAMSADRTFCQQFCLDRTFWFTDIVIFSIINCHQILLTEISPLSLSLWSSTEKCTQCIKNIFHIWYIWILNIQKNNSFFVYKMWNFFNLSSNFTDRTKSLSVKSLSRIFKFMSINYYLVSLTNFCLSTT